MFRRPTVAIKMETQLDGHSALLLSARAAHLRRDWLTSYESFARANQAAPLATDDLDALAAAAWRLGRCKESVRYFRAGVQAAFPQRSHGGGDEGGRRRAGLAHPRGSQHRSRLDEPGASTAGRRLRNARPPATSPISTLTSRHAPETPMRSSGRSTILREIVRAARHPRDDVPLSGGRGSRRYR